MKTHEHALISLAYAAGISFLAGNGMTDPAIYIAALVGGEIIDLIDHPLYHLVYNRDEPHVSQARKIFHEKGIGAAWKYLNEVEDDRQFKGLLLHNVFLLSLLAILGMLAAFVLSASVYLFVGIGALYLHMLTDIFGDFKILGNADNWLWPIPKKWIDYFGNMGTSLAGYIMVWSGFIQLTFFIITFRWGWQLAKPSITSGLLFNPTLNNLTVLAYIPLFGLAAYHLNLLMIVSAGAHKYRLEMGKNTAVSFSIGSLNTVWEFIRRKLRWNRQNFEKVLLRMQADIALWAVFLTATIASILLILTWFWGNSALWQPQQRVIFLLLPVFLALLFGTLVHTTVGEFGGVWGILLAWILNWIFGRLGVQALWDISLGYLLFGTAAGAWLLGLLGGIIFRGQSRMSMVAFSLQVNRTSKLDDGWLHDVIMISHQGLQQGYEKMHAVLYGDSTKSNFVTLPSTDMMLTPYRGRPILGEEYHHILAKDNYVPIVREHNYVLCDNRLTSTSKRVGQYGLLPVLPRQRGVQIEKLHGDMQWEGSKYHWLSKKRDVEIAGVMPVAAGKKQDHQWILFKTYSEILDHLVTRKSTIQTDIFMYPELDHVTICGITREFTSTKEYATVEAEAYAAKVVFELQELFKKHRGFKITQQTSARFFYPRLSFYDLDLAEWIQTSAILPSSDSGFPPQELAFIQKSLNKLPTKNLIPNATADFRKKLTILAGQYAIIALIGLIPLDPALLNTIKNIVMSLL